MAIHKSRTSLVAQMAKRLLTMQETGVWSLGWEDALEKEMARRKFLPGKSHGWRSVVGYSPSGRKESDTTDRLNNKHNMPGASHMLSHFHCTIHPVRLYHSLHWGYKESKSKRIIWLCLKSWAQIHMDWFYLLSLTSHSWVQQAVMDG